MKTTKDRAKRYRERHPERAREALRKWREANPEYQRIYWSKNYLWLRARRYGMTRQEFGEMLKAQDGKCAICPRELILGGKGGMQIDHDPRTGRVRGLLCRCCNVGLGMFAENPELMRLAINYLQIKI